MNAVELLRRLHQHRPRVKRNLLTAADLRDGQLRSPFATGQGSVCRSLVHLYAGKSKMCFSFPTTEQGIAAGRRALYRESVGKKGASRV